MTTEVATNTEAVLHLSVEDKFKAHVALANEWLEKAKTLRVTDSSQTGLMKESRETRLILRKTRLEIEALHKREKAEYLEAGRKIDSLKNKYVALIEPVEKLLQENEDFIEIQEAKAKEELKSRRFQEIYPLIGEEARQIALGELSEETYLAIKDGYIARKKAKDEEIERVKAENAERERKDREERQRLKEQNDRLLEERAKLEAKAAEERKIADAKLKAERDKNRQLEIENNARIAQEEQEKKLRASQERKAKRAPDKAKLLVIALEIMDIHNKVQGMSLKDEDAQKILKATEKALLTLAKNINDHTENL